MFCCLTSSLFIDFFYLLPFLWDAPSSLPMFNISKLHFSIIFSTFHVIYYLWDIIFVWFLLLYKDKSHSWNIMLLFVCFIGSLRTLQEITTKMGLWGSNYDEKLIKLINCNLEFEWKELFQVISTPISSELYYLGCNKVWSLNWNQIIYGKLWQL